MRRGRGGRTECWVVACESGGSLDKWREMGREGENLLFEPRNSE